MCGSWAYFWAEIIHGSKLFGSRLYQFGYCFFGSQAQTMGVVSIQNTFGDHQIEVFSSYFEHERVGVYLFLVKEKTEA